MSIWYFLRCKAINDPKKFKRTDKVYLNKENEKLNSLFNKFVKVEKVTEIDIEKLLKNNVKDHKPNMTYKLIDHYYVDSEDFYVYVIDILTDHYPSWYFDCKELLYYKRYKICIDSEENKKYTKQTSYLILNVQVLFKDFISLPTMNEQLSKKCNNFNTNIDYYITNNYELKLLYKNFTKKKYGKYKNCLCFYIKDAIEKILNNGGLKENEFIKLYYR